MALVCSGLGSSALGETTLAEFLPSPVNRYDGLRSRCAHSCGAVAEFNRLPEHPGEFDYYQSLDFHKRAAEKFIVPVLGGQTTASKPVSLAFQRKTILTAYRLVGTIQTN
jgi:hypothetical protein